jgi:hypothetical protein
MKPFEMASLLSYAQMSYIFSNIDMISELHDILGKKLRESVDEKENVFKIGSIIQTFKHAVILNNNRLTSLIVMSCIAEINTKALEH